MDSNATHPNAYRTEAEQKRLEATRLIEEANRLEDQANAIEVAEHPELAEPVDEPEQSGTDSEADKPGVFRKKK